MPPDPPSGSHLQHLRAPPTYITLATALFNAVYNSSIQVLSPSVKPLFFQALKDDPSLSGLLKKSLLKKMTTERCAKLMAVGMANNLDETWISEHPFILMVYLNQYFPNLTRWYVQNLVKSQWLRQNLFKS